MDFLSFKYNGSVLTPERDTKGIYNSGQVPNKLYYIVFCSFLYWIGLLTCITHCKLKYQAINK